MKCGLDFMVADLFIVLAMAVVAILSAFGIWFAGMGGFIYLIKETEVFSETGGFLLWIIKGGVFAGVTFAAVSVGYWQYRFVIGKLLKVRGE